MSKGLKELKELIIKLKSLGYTRCDEWLGFIIIERELKALEIIKNKKVDIKYLYYRAEFNIEKYNDNYIETLTQEEINLLKEILIYDD